MRQSTGIEKRISWLIGISVFLLMLSASAATAESISGYVFNDANQNGVMEVGEAGLPNWTVTLAGILDALYTASATTDGNGYYEFLSLAQDGYIVAEISQPGWTQTTPSSYTIYDIYYDPTAVVTNINFGNYGSSPSPSPSSGVEGKMTGEGSVLAIDGTRVKYEFELNCDATKKSKLEVKWDKNKFILESLDPTSVGCSDDPLIDPEKPSAGFDTYTGEGTGRYNKMPGYKAIWTFTDAGKSGKDDTAWIKILDPSGTTTVLEASGTLKDGNNKAHKK